MKELNKYELNNISGGITGTVFNSIVRAFTLVLELGRTLGSSIRRIISGKYC